jgi:hypothetical protein
MHDFKHHHLNRVYPRWKADPNGGIAIDAWFIVPAGILTNPQDGFFDENKLRELGDAAVMYAKSKGLTCDIYVVES